ncbi:SulA-like leucine-rich domain-containing protein [Echinimonas agarilytica]|uniref:SulA-like leucine-rich domain-containing protein n=1 Tax=Echinimonas agarilytica TaxID=1215918 RepID=A0AA42B891_9GAMM|nr:SulA-like leucine-rich domain-containing protein [Echinimonas agarilytica]MCM2680920.1 SulA-like leucine-rich domain-containing protein [Echinimonas agarilytica]
MKHLLQTKIKHPGVWHPNGLNTVKTVTSGHAFIDSELPNGGWQSGHIYEVLAGQHSAVFSLLKLTLKALSQQRRWLVLLNPPKWVLDEISEMKGLRPEHLLIVHGRRESDTLWATEQAMRNDNAACILAWPDSLDERDIKRLKLASKGKNALSFVFPMEDTTASCGSQLKIIAHQHSSDAQKIVLPCLENNQLDASNDNLH